MNKSEEDHLYNGLVSMEDSSLAAQAFLENHISVAKLDLRTGQTFILKSDLDQEIVGGVIGWPDLIERYLRRRVYPPDKEVLASYTLERMRELSSGSHINKCVELRCMSGNRSGDDCYEWIELTAYKVGKDDHTLLVSTKNIDEARLVRSIVDLFIYRNYDYLFLINAKNDSYTRFTRSKVRTPIPPEKGIHYTEDMIRFNRKYVAPEDYDRVTGNMQIPHVLRMLERSDSYSFTSGGITNDGEYRRSRVMFLFYDKTAGLILCARSDVTQIYMEEQEKSRKLHEALRSAQLDAMTGIYNQKATAELVTRSLESQYRKAAAFLFIDVDNFKMVNDTMGHQMGDDLLCFLARRIQEIAGRNGIAGRLGGDEYLLYLPDISSIREAEEAAREICDVFSTFPGQQREAVSCSVGISVYPRDGTDYETLLRKADQALYTSKRYGKKRYYQYSLEVDQFVGF